MKQEKCWVYVYFMGCHGMGYIHKISIYPKKMRDMVNHEGFLFGYVIFFWGGCHGYMDVMGYFMEYNGIYKYN
jgi:hypothetical protein